jgi:hypothetical protein
MAVEGIDFAWSKPSPAEAKAVGAHWGAGYFSNDSTKNLTHSLVSAYLAAGLGIVSVWETTTGRATQGRAAGIADARAADAQRAAVGLPATAPIHFAVDEDTSWASVALYFEGVISVLGLSRTGTYGGLHVIEGAHSIGIKYLWQTVAWSGGIWASYATIRQPGGTVLSGGSDLDYSEVPDFGQVPRPVAVTPPTKPVPPVVVPPVVLPVEETMYLVTVNRAEYPDPKTWPGTFLLTSAGTLRHVMDDADLVEFQKLGLKSCTISKVQYDSLVAGK